MNDSLEQRYATIKAALPPGVTLVAVSKTRSVAEIQALYELGQRDFGENYPQELRAKQPALPQDIRWHFIGHLQRSNVKHIVSFIHLIHGVDSFELLEEIQKRARSVGRVIDVLVQVHIAKEETKHGVAVPHLLAELGSWPWTQLPNVRLRGLMGMATMTEDREQVRQEFSVLQGLWRVAREQMHGPATPFDLLSMGMSGDADLAIAEGSTLVRIGSALFGERA